MKKLLITLLVLAALAAGGYAGRDNLASAMAAFQEWRTEHTKAAKTEPKGTPPPAVSVLKTEAAPFTETVAVTGSLVPRDEILVAPEVEGFRVLELKVDEGDQVKKGDVLAILVQISLNAQLAQNDAALARAEAAISRAKSQIVEATARLEQAKSAFERAKPLKNSGYLSGSTYDERDAAAKTTQAQLVAARDSLKVAQAEKAQVEAQRSELEWRRSNTQVKAPADGLISRRTARIGGLASSIGQPMFRIIANGEVELDAEVLETELVKIKIGQKARVNVAGVGDVEGTVRLISPEVDNATRLGRVRIFLGDDPSLHIGSFGSGVITTAHSRGLAVPATAVMFGPDGAFVQVIRSDRVESRKIKTGLVADGFVEVHDGLAEGDIIVAKAGTFLRDGDTVRAIQPSAKISEAK